MGSSLVRVVGAVLAGGLALAGCGSQEEGGAADGTSSSASSSASASRSPSTTASSADSGEAKKRASSATKKALLPDAAFEKIGLEVDMPPEEKKWDWFESCRPFLPSESKQVTGHHGRWKGEGAIIDQTVVAYPDGVAEDIVGEVKKTVTCSEYSAGESDYSKVASVTLPKIPEADAVHGWCMTSSKDHEVCHSVFAEQDLVSSIWVIANQKEDALDALGVMTALAAKRIEAQIQ